MPKALTEEALERLNRYLISEDVIIDGPMSETWTIALGPEVVSHGYEGIMFDEKAYFSGESIASLPQIPEEIVDDWRALTGWLPLMELASPRKSSTIKDCLISR